MAQVTDSRQRSLFASAVLSYADFTSGAAKDLFSLPAKSILVDGGVEVYQSWDNTATIDVGFDYPAGGGTDDPDGIVDGLSLATAAGGAAFGATAGKKGKYLPLGGMITGTVTTSTASTTGQLQVWVEYIVDGRTEAVYED